MKSALQIVEDVFTVLYGSYIADEITGDVWRSPAVFTGKEDIVVSCHSVNNEPLEMAEVHVNVHVPNITAQKEEDHDTQPDEERIKEIAEMVQALLNGYQEAGFTVIVVQPAMIVRDEKTGNYFANIKLNYFTENSHEPVTFLKPVKTKNQEGGTEITYAVDGNTVNANAIIKTTDHKIVFEAGFDAVVNTREVLVRDTTNWQPIDKDWILRQGGYDHAILSKENLSNHFVKFVAISKSGNFLQSDFDYESEGGTGGEVVGDPSGPTLTITVIGTGNLQFYANKAVTVDWGDGSPVQVVTSASHYYTNGPFDLVIYHHNEPSILLLSSNFINIEEVAGVFPASLQKFSATNMGVSDVPELPATIKELGLSYSALTTTVMDAIITRLADGSVSNGVLSLNNQTTGQMPSNTEGINELTFRGWEINV